MPFYYALNKIKIRLIIVAFLIVGRCTHLKALSSHKSDTWFCLL